MDHFNPNQRILLSAEYLFDIKSFSEFETLFSYLPSVFEENHNTGRPKTPSLSSLKCFIYMSISGLKNLSELRRALLNNPSLCLKCGFDPSHLPPVERFSSFLKNTSSTFFERIQIELVRKLMAYGVISGRYLTIDACSVPIQCRENNLKTSVRDRFNKMHPPKADPQAGLGVMINYLRPFDKKVTYFWGYKNHILSDAISELPLCELTRPANVSEGKLLVPIIKRLKKSTDVAAEAVIGDAAYDSQVKSEVHSPRVTCKTGHCSQIRLGKISESHDIQKRNTHLYSWIRNDLLGTFP